MAKAQAAEATAEQSAAVTAIEEKLLQMEEQLKAMPDLPDDVRKSTLKQARERFYDGAKDAIDTAVTRVLQNTKLEEHRQLLSGNTLTISIRFTKNGSFTATTRLRTTKSNKRSKGSNTGSAKPVKVNGTEYPSAAAACRDLGIEHAGNSAVRVLERKVATGEIDSFEQL